MFEAALKRGDDETFAELRASLTAAGFTVERIEETFGTHSLSARPSDTAVHVRRLGDDAFSTVARLFVLGLPADPRALGAADADRLVALGLARRGGEELEPTVRLVPHGDLYIASDLQPAGEVAPDFVAGIQAPSVALAKLVVRKPAAKALDLGTGCGIQGLLAARHCERVVATDVNERALRFAELNARLNGIGGIELRPGDGFDPVQGERFDLVVANPPYVISPDVAFLYRDNPLPGDELCRQLVEAAPDHLEEGGFAVLLVSWVAEPGEAADVTKPLRTWVAGRDCDAWLLHYKTEDPLTHSANWLRPLADDPTEFERELDRWRAYLADLGIEAVAYGAVILRRRSDRANWMETDPLPLDRLEPASDHITRVFAARDFLHDSPDDALLAERFSLVEPHRLEQTLRAENGTLGVESQTLALADGLAFQVGLDRYTGAIVPQLDGRQTVREALERAASDLGLDEREHNRFVEAGLPVVRRLFALGFLRR